MSVKENDENIYDAETMYGDIINMQHHRSTKRQHMSITDRAAQFSSFSALTGYDEVIRETGERITEKMVLGENEEIDII